jgi:hypothetical protein
MPTVTYISSATLLRSYMPRRSRRRFRSTPEIEFAEPVVEEPFELEPIDVGARIQEALETGPPPKPEEPFEVNMPLFASVYLEDTAA